MVFVTGAEAGISNISSRTLLFLVLSGLATGASWLCYFHALQKGDVNKVVPIDKSSTILTILLALIFLQEGLSLGKGVGIVLIGVGTMLMITRKGMANQEKSSDGSWFIYAVFSAVFASLTAILGKAGIEGVDSNLGTAIRTTVVLVMAWFMVFVTGEQKKVRTVEKIGEKHYVQAVQGMGEFCLETICPIISGGDVTGAVLLLEKEEKKNPELDEKMAQGAADFLGRQMG